MVPGCWRLLPATAARLVWRLAPLHHRARARTRLSRYERLLRFAPLDPPTVRPESNLADTDVWIGHGAEVVGADGHRLGRVHDVLFDDAGALTGVVVRAGVYHRHDVEIPAA